MLPNVKHIPSVAAQSIIVPLVPIGRCRELCCPPLAVRLGKGAVCRTGVPEASVDEHRQADSYEDDVRPAGQVGAMQPVTDSPAMQRSAQDQFRRSIPRSLASHELSHQLRRRRWSPRFSIHAEPA